MLKHDGEGIASRLGRPLTQGETYLIHFLGPEDAERFMKKMDDDPRASAAALLPKAAKANKPIFYERQGRRMKGCSVREVHEAFEAMMDKRTIATRTSRRNCRRACRRIRAVSEGRIAKSE